MQSKLFVLRLLSACTQHHWQHCRELEKEKNPDAPPSSLRVILPPLDAALISFILVLMSRYVTQYHLIEESSNLEQNNTPQPYIDLSENENGYTYEQIKLSLITDIYKASSKILYYISASNWDACYAKIKNAVLSLDSINGASDEIPPEIRMLESSCLTRDRLFTIFSELSPYYLHMRHEGKLLFSKMIRRAIWKWIEEFPSEFAQVCTSNGRLPSGSEVLFDMCNSTADNSRKKAILWPLQTILLVLSPELLLQAFLDTSPTHNRRANFLSLLRKSLQTTRNVDIAAVCYVDLCKAATFVPPDNDSMLRSIAADVEAELKEKVWDFNKTPSSESTLAMLGYTIDQQKLTTDFLLAHLRLHPEDILKTIVPSCVPENVPILYKLALVKTCLIIVQDENHLPWNPKISSMYNGLCTPLRKLFLQTTNIDLNSSAISKKRETHSNHNNRVELLLDMLRLFRIDPQLALLGDDEDRVEQNSAFMSGLATLVQHPVRRIRQESLELLLKMHHVEIVNSWGPTENALANFWQVSSPVLLNIARQILDCKSNEEYHKTLLQLLIRLFKTRYQFLKTKKAYLSSNPFSMRERLQAAIAIEIALLVSLCSPNKEICDESLKSIGQFCREARIVDLSDEEQAYSLSIYSNLKAYEDLCADDSRFVGRKAQQKRIRKYIRMFPTHTPGNMAAWEEAWMRWKQLTVLINRLSDENAEDNSFETNSTSISGINSSGTTLVSSNSTINSNSSNKKLPLPRAGGDKMMRNVSGTSTLVSVPKSQQSLDFCEEKAIEWQNYTGFLAALGSCCLTDSDGSKPNSIVEQSHRASSPSEPSMMVDRFISDMTDMLISDNVRIREGIKDIIGNDLSPALYVSLFRHLEVHMNRFFDSNGDAIRSPQNKLFVEQAVLSLKLILDRLVNPSDCLLNIDFSVLINKFADYLNGLPNTYITMRIKIKMCFLIETIMHKKEQVIIRDEMRLRNKLLEIIVEWTSDFAIQRKPVEAGQHVDRLQKDLDQACLKAIVSLLEQLPLQPSEAVRPAEISQIKSKMFLKYFAFFRKFLDRYKQSERDVNKLSVSTSAMNGQLMSPRDSSFKPLASGSTGGPSSEPYTDVGQMKELTVLAMSHLLSANVDAGLKYSLSMGYDEDQEARKAFMQVLTNILDHGIEFETLAENVMTDRYEKLIDILVDADMEIVMSLCEVCPSQDTTDVAEILLICFESRGKVISLLKAVVQREISLTEQEATLFRGTTMATRILSIFAKLSCLDYVRITLQPAMEEINALPDDQLTWELDPTKVGSVDEIARNKRNVVKATEIFLNAICGSVDNAPKVFREELSLISEAVNSRFPEAKSTAVGGFVFLRLFGPAILTPEQAGFAKQALPKNTNVRKILLQATRIMQNLANNILFGSKETHMIVLNDFLTSNIYKVTSFLRAISTVPAGMEDASSATLRMDQSGYVRLHKYLSDNMERMTRDLTSRRLLKGSSDQSLLGWKRTLDRLSNLLAQLGTPSEISGSSVSYARNYTVANSNHIYSEFMRRNGHRDVTPINGANMFYKGGNSKGGRPVFYMVCRHLDVDETDFELLTYYMLRVMEPYLGQPFEFLFDLTEFTSSRSIPINWFTQFFQLVFSEMNDYLVTLHLYNPTVFMAKRIRQLPRDVVNKLVKRARFYTSLTELSEFIAPANIKLPKETLNMERETCVTVSPVSRISNLKSSVPITVKIGPEHIQLITIKKQEIISNLSTVYRDVLHISDIEDVVSLPSVKPENGGEVSIKYDRGKSIMVLSSTKRDLLVQLLRQSKQRYETSQPVTTNERSVRPSDVPGRLLNMALLNIGSENPGLRLTAYNLLYSLSLSFRFDIGNQLLNARDLCIPSNSTDFIVSISESLAQSEIHLTLEFLNEALTGLLKCTEPMRQLCLDYMAPWLRNLGVYARHSPEDHKKNLSKTKDVIKLLIDLTSRHPEIYKHVQAKIWKTIAEVDDVTNLVIECFVQYSVENGVGSPQAEIVADTLVTMSSVSIRGKVISRMRRVIENTSVQPCRHLVEHTSWNEIAVLLRFILMLSFNNTGPVVPCIPEIFHIVSLLVVTGPTFIRSSVHELVVNTIHTLCTLGVPLIDDNIKKLQFVLNDVCDSKNRVAFGLTKQHANAFTITKETITDFAEAIDLTSLQTIVRLLLDALNFGAPTVDIANMWRARWMGLVASTAFYFNPAIQPRSFVTLGCLAQDEVDDDLIYQVLVALKGALAIFNESDSSLIVSIMMCLSNIIDNLPADSRYLLQLFWLAIALVQVGHTVIFQTAVEFLQSVLRALDARKLFVHRSIEQVLLEARIELGDVADELDSVCGVDFTSYFSFAVAVILLKGLKQCENKDVVFQCLTAFLEIDCKRPMEQSYIEAKTLGYLAGLLPFAAKDNTLRELLRLAGINDMELDGIDFGTSHTGLFELLEIPDNSTALLLISLLVTLLNASDNESERLFLYSLLADAATSVPEVFALVYESLLPKMNQMVVNSQNQEVIEAVKSILLTACSEPAFIAVGQASTAHKRTQKWGLDNLKFSSLGDPTFGAIKTNIGFNAKLASKLLGAITDQR
ncbi:uncharacterized protein B0P05DRAFT_546306 [Gilbertella persicaria]|uniref:uncharacterized protein n=1 Tax=Gilbertella persicaria TaxID=101096 RepID=UPI002220DB63|nr:uncharacterized protein B0P05DRAFT_546306 [Gilbertella persicaria]KAI8076544.1 hypothetical protein B0P05DRAFT_546306 [Gilbertella persicaria]